MVNNDVKKNLVLITSVINTPNKPLSYSSIRSVFTRKERFEQTKKTIKSIKDKIPNNKIIIVECTDFTKEEKDYLEKECEYILNLWDKKELHDNIFGRSKSLGEGTMTIEALKYIEELKVDFDYLYKISGRYWLNDNFKINKDDNNVFKKINNEENNIFTALYKIDKNIVEKLLYFLINNIENMKKCIGYEVLISHFVKNIDKKFVDSIGLSGFITVCGNLLNM
jgi:thymidylate synthase